MWGVFLLCRFFWVGFFFLGGGGMFWFGGVFYLGFFLGGGVGFGVVFFFFFIYCYAELEGWPLAALGRGDVDLWQLPDEQLSQGTG